MCSPRGQENARECVNTHWRRRFVRYLQSRSRSSLALFRRPGSMQRVDLTPLENAHFELSTRRVLINSRERRAEGIARRSLLVAAK